MSLLTTLVKPQAISPSKTIARCSMRVCVRQFDNEGYNRNSRRRGSHHDATRRAGIGSIWAQDRLEEVFIRSLVAAGSCRQHRRRTSNIHGGRRGAHDIFCRSENPPASRRARGFSSKTTEQLTAVALAPASPPPMAPEISKAEYEELVDTYPGFGQPLPKRKTKHERKSVPHFPLAPPLIMTPDQELRSDPGKRVVLAAEDDAHQHAIDDLQTLLKGRLGRTSQSKLWEAWEALRSPRPRYLDDATLSRLFRHLTWVEHKHAPDAMQRFLSVMDACLAEQVALAPQVWNTAISFAGRWVRRVSSAEVKNAVEMWLRMERASVHADATTFNILFDVALKAGRFALAETIFSEFRARGLPPNRYTRSGLIYYAGLRRDGDGVRQAFQDFVDADEIVDTGVMNTVIASLLRAGEPAAAESVFHKMKALHARKATPPTNTTTTAAPPTPQPPGSPKSWQARRELGTLLKHAGASLRRERRLHETSFFGARFATAARREQLQRATPIGPDAATYRLLIQYHAYTSADAHGAAELLDEMREAGMHVHGSVYYHLFCGYKLHGGTAFSAWSRKGLEALWGDLLAAVQERGTVVDAETGAGEDRVDGTNHRADPRTAHHARPDGDISEELVAEWEPQRTDPRSAASEDAGDEDANSELERRPYFSRGLAIAAIRAFRHCAGRDRTLEVWAEILARWKDVTPWQRAKVQEVVDECVRHNGLYRT